MGYNLAIIPDSVNQRKLVYAGDRIAQVGGVANMNKMLIFNDLRQTETLSQGTWLVRLQGLKTGDRFADPQRAVVEPQVLKLAPEVGGHPQIG